MNTQKKYRKSYFPPVVEEIAGSCESLFASSSWTDASMPDAFVELYEL